jgi:very-short-patch-repair endonuclease
MESFLPYLWFALIIIVAIGLLLLVVLSKFYKTHKASLPYTKTPLLTASELQFFAILESVLPDHCYLLTQVRLANLVTIKPGLGFSWKHFNPIGMKCVDFVICDHATMRPLLVVELDDRSHDRVERQERDRFVNEVLSSVGLPILHWPTSRGYRRSEVAEELRRRIQGHMV